ncbi:hypothetical protein NFI96_013634 [Prochilodus magdalenae]|nr:hypothetical protein NFI96_013634 [Prochilodus magdalenae]
MSKSLKKKNHWTNKVHEAVLTRNKEGELGFDLKGGAENGNFPYFGEVRQGKVAIQSGKLAQDELLLEVNDTPVAGLTTRDVLAVIKHCKDPFRLKCVKQVMGCGGGSDGLKKRQSWAEEEAVMGWRRGSHGLERRQSWPGEEAVMGWRGGYHWLERRQSWAGEEAVMGWRGGSHGVGEEAVMGWVRVSHGLGKRRSWAGEEAVMGWRRGSHGLERRQSWAGSVTDVRGFSFMCILCYVCLMCVGGVVDKDLRHYLNLRFQKGSVDHELQQIIRDNLYLRTVPYPLLWDSSEELGLSVQAAIGDLVAAAVPSALLESSGCCCVECTTRQPKEGEVPGVDYNFVSVDRFMELEKSGALLESGTYEDNFYGTPKPPAEPTPMLFNVTDQLLPGARPSAEGKRKRNKSVSNMEKDSIEPPEEEQEESPVVNGNGIAITPESSEHEDKSTDASGDVPPQSCPPETPTLTATDAPDEEGEAPKSPPDSQGNDDLGPLPDNWEMAYTEKGEVYFIEHDTININIRGVEEREDKRERHRKEKGTEEKFRKQGRDMLRGRERKSENDTRRKRYRERERERRERDRGEIQEKSHNTKTTSWLDPRLAKKAKPPEECEDDELPYGWEKIDDPIYGSYYVDHINRRTQFENPVLEAKRRIQQQQQMQSQGLSALPLPTIYREKPPFTRDATQLKGTFLSTALQKSSMGFGFTIIGGDEPDEFLQVKSVIPEGPAAQDGKMATGDVIVYINDICVLGTTHADVVKLFQSVPIGQSVTLVLCRGYPLPYDPEDPSASSSMAPLGLVDHPLLLNGRNTYDNYMEYMSLTGRLVPEHGDGLPPTSHPGDTHLDGSQPPSLNTPGAPPDDSVSMASSSGATAGAQAAPELLSLTMTKGSEGFGFTIADSPTGQRVKQVLEPQGCPGLCEGDLIVEINQQGLQGLNHSQVVQILKDCAVGTDATLVVQRTAGTGHFSPWDGAKQWDPQGSPQTSLSGPGLSHSAPHPGQALHCTSASDAEGKPDPYDLYEKSRAIYESRRPGLCGMGLGLCGMGLGLGGMGLGLCGMGLGLGGMGLGLCGMGLGLCGMGLGLGGMGLGLCGMGLGLGGMGLGLCGMGLGLCGMGLGLCGMGLGLCGMGLGLGRMGLGLCGMGLGLCGMGLGLGRMGLGPCGMGLGLCGMGLGLGGMGLGLGGMGLDLCGMGLGLCGMGLGLCGMGLGLGGMGLGLCGMGLGLCGMGLGLCGMGLGLCGMGLGLCGMGLGLCGMGLGLGGMGLGLCGMGLGVEYQEVEVHLLREKTGFGFRILGGDEAVQAIVIGAIIENSPAERDGRLRPGDELVSVDRMPVAGRPHRYVIDLMHAAARNGQVTLTVKRRVLPQPSQPCGENGAVTNQSSSPRGHAVCPVNLPPTTDVVIHRKETEGFGFVIISSLNRPENTATISVPHKIGRIIEGSPADRCGKLKVGDRIMAVNNQSIINMPHADIVKLIKDAGLTVTLHIIPEEDVSGPHSAPTSEKQSPLVAQKHSPQTQSSPAAQQSPTVVHPSPPAPHPSPATTQPSPQLVDPGPGGPQGSPSMTQTTQPVSQPCLEAVQSASVVTQAGPVVDQGIPGVPGVPVVSGIPVVSGVPVVPVVSGVPVIPGVQLSSMAGVPVPVPPQLYLHDSRSEVKARQDVKPDICQPPYTDYRQPPVDYRHPPVADYRQPPTMDYRHPPPLIDYRQHSIPDYRPQDYDYFTVELEKSVKGFGFSIRGGREYKMDLFVLRLAEDGPAIRNGRMRVGDQIIEINGESTRDMSHARAIELIKAGGRRVRLLLKRGTGQVPEYGG